MAAQDKITKLINEPGTLELEGVSYEVMRYYSIFQLNSIPSCRIVVIPKDGEALTVIYSELAAVTPGAWLTLSFPLSGLFLNAPSRDLPIEQQLSKVDVTVFNGRFLGWAPVKHGSLLEIIVYAVHDLIGLDWSSSITDEVHGRALGDPLLKMAAVANESIVPFMPEPYKDNVTSDIWKNLIKPEFLKILEYKRFADPNSTGSDVLENMDLSSDELPLSLEVETARRAIIDIRRTIYMPSGGNTLWDKLVQLADRYLFAISPRIDGFSVIPYTPLLSGTSVPVLSFEEFVTENNFNAYVGRYFDAVELMEGGASFSNPFDIVGRKPDLEKLRQLSSFGSEFYATGIYSAPSWTQVGNDLSFMTKQTTGIDGSIRAVGYALEAGPADTGSNTPNKQYNEGGADAERFAKAMLNDELFKQRTAYLQSTLRFDLAPGNLIAVEMPSGVSGEAGYYGTVHTVCNSITAGLGYAGTWVILDNVRTPAEQKSVKDTKHPLYGNTWVSAPLLDPEESGLADHVPGFVGS